MGPDAFGGEESDQHIPLEADYMDKCKLIQLQQSEFADEIN